MRSYPHNSPQAAARLLALTLVADGSASGGEFQVLDAQAERLGLSAEQLRDVIRDVCEDLHCGSRRQWGRGLDEAGIDALLAEVSEPRLRQQVLATAFSLAQADHHLSEGEGRLLARMNRQWQPELWLSAA